MTKKRKIKLIIITVILVIIVYLLYTFIPTAVPMKDSDEFVNISMLHNYNTEVLDDGISTEVEYEGGECPELEELIRDLKVYRNNFLSNNITDGGQMPEDGFRYIGINVTKIDKNNIASNYRIYIYNYIGGIDVISDGRRGIEYPYISKEEHLELFEKLEGFMKK